MPPPFCQINPDVMSDGECLHHHDNGEEQEQRHDSVQPVPGSPVTEAFTQRAKKSAHVLSLPASNLKRFEGREEKEAGQTQVVEHILGLEDPSGEA